MTKTKVVLLSFSLLTAASGSLWHVWGGRNDALGESIVSSAETNSSFPSQAGNALSAGETLDTVTPSVNLATIPLAGLEWEEIRTSRGTKYKNGDVVIRENATLQLAPDSVHSGDIDSQAVDSRAIKNHTIRGIDIDTGTALDIASLVISGGVDIGGTLSTAGLSVSGDATILGDLNIGNLSYTWPTTHVGGVLSNDGTGTLTWETLGAASITDDSLDFTKFADALALDTSTDIAIDGSEVFSLTNTGTGNSFVVNDASSDTTPFVIDASGNVGIGTSSPQAALDLTSNASSLSVRDASGTSQTTFNSYAAREWEIAYGTTGSPVTTSGPTVKISRTEQVAASSCGGNQVDNECNSALSVHSHGTASSEMQVNALSTWAQGSSTVAGTDVVGILSVGRVTGSGVGLGTGAYLEGRRDTATGKAVGAEIRVTNETTSASTYNNDGISSVQGLWITASSTGGYDAGAGLSFDDILGSQFVTGIGFMAGSILTTSIDDSSSSTTSIGINGSHTYAMTVASGAGKVGIGTTTPSYALDILDATAPQLRVRSSGAVASAITIDNQAGGNQSNITLSDAGSAKWQFGKQTNNTFFLYDVANVRDALRIDDTTNVLLAPVSGNVGIGDTSPAALLTVGSGDLFQVNSSGAIAAATGITSSGTITFSGLSTAGLVTNTSGGVLGTTTTLGASYITADSLDFTELKDALALDVSTDIAIDGSEVFSLTNTGTGNSFVVNDASSDTTPFVVDASGAVGIGTTSPTGLLNMAGSYSVTNGALLNLNATLSASGTGQQNRIINQGSIDLTAASTVTAVYGFINLPSIAGSSSDPDLSNAIGTFSRIDTAASYTGTIASGRAFESGDPSLAGGVPITSYTGYYASGITNGNGVTSGTISNFGVRVSAHTAAAGSGGTINNYGAYITVPSGSGAGTTNNYGVTIAGNVSGAYALYSSSTSNSYFAGNVGIGDTSPAAALTVGSGDLFQVNSSGAIAAATGYVQASGTMSLTSANTTGTTTSSVFALNANSLTSGTGMYLASSSLTSGRLLDIAVSGTAATASQTGLNILNSGATATSGITTYGAQISNTRTNATSGTNVALYLNASGATTANYGLIVNSGSVGIGTAGPGYPLEVVGATSTQVRVRSTGSNSGAVIIDNQAGGQQSSVIFADAATSKWQIGKQTNNTFFLYDGANARNALQIDTSTNVLLTPVSGNVGIGDTSPAALLTVGSGDLFQVSSTGNVSTTGQIAGTDGVVTKVNAGACDDSVFTADTNGNLCIDSTNGRIYYRYGGAWHYSAQTAGFQIPSYEAYGYDFATHSFDTDRALQPDDFLIPFVENFMEDGAVHGLYAKFSDVKDTLLADEQNQIAELTLQTNQNVNTLAGLQVSIDDQLIVIGGTLNDLTKSDKDTEEKLEQHEEYFVSDQSRIASLEKLHEKLSLDMDEQASRITLVETSVEVLTEQLNTLTDFYSTFDLGNLVAKDEDGNVDLLDGKLKARILETGALAIEVEDTDRATIGRDKMENGETKATIKTKGVSAKSHIIVTPRDLVKEPLAVTTVTDGESFTVEIPTAAEKDISFDWWIVDSK